MRQRHRDDVRPDVPSWRESEGLVVVMAALRVMTWNVQNLFLPGDGDGPDTAASFDAKLATLARVIDDARPHILALQEVGPDPVLEHLQAALAHPMKYKLAGMPDSRGIRVALLSSRVMRHRKDVVEAPPGLTPVQVSDDPGSGEAAGTMSRMGRGALTATVRAGNRDVAVVSCHLKSKLLTFPGGRFFARDEDERARYAAYALYRRTLEAATLRVHLTQLLETANGAEDGGGAVVLAGDLNDEPSAATTQILHGPPGSEIGTPGFDRADRGDGQRMWNLAPLIPSEERATRRYRGRDELIDHLLVSHVLVTRVSEVRTLTPAHSLPSITDEPAPVPAHAGSDHAAVIATFDL